MAPTELAPDADGNPVFCFGLAGFERDGLTEKFLKECPVRADQVGALSAHQPQQPLFSNPRPCAGR